MTRSHGDGPAWLGIGAQRSGTTWFTDLLLRHPDVCLPASGRKELHYFDDAVVTGWLPDAGARYRAQFDSGCRAPGEFTPGYLRCPWVPPLAYAACPDVSVILALLRDPVDRFASAMRLYWRLPDREPAAEEGRLLDWARDRGSDSVWGGMYASQLDAWRAWFGPDRMHVLQYEAVRADPAAALRRVWGALGLDPVAVGPTDEASRTTTDRDEPQPWLELPGLRERLVELYRPQVARLAAEWGVDPALWSSFA